jgi:hypothetical protein
MNDALDVLEPQAREVSYRGERLEIRPLTVGQLPRLVRTARPVLDALFAQQALPEMPAEGATVDRDTLELLLDLVGDHGDAVFEAAALAVGRDAEWVAGGDPAEFAELATAVIEVNRDFFVRKLAPLLGGRAAIPDASGAGQTASSS